jgi:hypothetical protein
MKVVYYLTDPHGMVHAEADEPSELDSGLWPQWLLLQTESSVLGFIYPSESEWFVPGTVEIDAD